MKQIPITLLALLFVFQNLYAGTIKIPNDQPTIQVGIVSSSNGDTILVAPGTYYENINFNGKNIVLGSLFLTTGDTSYISQTVIDGNQQGCVVVFENGEDSTATLTGFTITNGYSYSNQFRGGGITCLNSSSSKLMYLNIKNNIVLGESGRYGGGGVLCSVNSKATIYESIIQNNITDDAFELNLSGGFGGGVFCDDSSSIRIINSSVKSNSARFGGGITSYNSLLESAKISIRGIII